MLLHNYYNELEYQDWVNHKTYQELTSKYIQNIFIEKNKEFCRTFIGSDCTIKELTSKRIEEFLDWQNAVKPKIWFYKINYRLNTII